MTTVIKIVWRQNTLHTYLAFSFFPRYWRWCLLALQVASRGAIAVQRHHTHRTRYTRPYHTALQHTALYGAYQTDGKHLQKHRYISKVVERKVEFKEQNKHKAWPLHGIIRAYQTQSKHISFQWKATKIIPKNTFFLWLNTKIRKKKHFQNNDFWSWSWRSCSILSWNFW